MWMRTGQSRTLKALDTSVSHTNSHMTNLFSHVKMSSEMKAIGVAQYGAVDNLESKRIPRPSKPTGRQMRVQTKAISINPIDIKVRQGTYDDAPDYYDRVRALTQEDPKFHVIGYDGAGIVLEVGPDVKHFQPGEEIYYLGNPVMQGCYAEEVLVDERHAGHKPRRLDFVESAAMPLTYGTAFESLVDRLGIQKGERAGILIINGGGGLGSIASQIARHYLNLPVVITTASRPETKAFSQDMGATHVVNHREDIVKQIRDLQLPPMCHSSTPTSRRERSSTSSPLRKFWLPLARFAASCRPSSTCTGRSS
ncbi:unnamed protein product [Periconia digitata]|uniref:Enoyl reductase (ER) domain-containing protein n=1 Tax=Periconia digitata TaxID=1303443 RepID=A0A9W4UF77_9PLEO|nr:unnamed protein product [Periconia digitata]